MSNYFEEQREKMRSYFEEQREKAVAKAAEKAAAKAEKQAQEGFAMRLIKRGKDTLDEIAECTGLTLRRVKALAKTATA